LLLGANGDGGSGGDDRHSGLLLANRGVWDLADGLGGVWLPDDGGVWSRGDDLLCLGGGLCLGHVPGLGGIVGHRAIDGRGLVDLGGLLVDRAFGAELGGAGG